MMTGNAAAYFGVTYGLLREHYEVWLGLITLGLALFYGLVAYAALMRKAVQVQVILFTVAIALVFLTVAVPLQLTGVWITIAWAAEGAALMIVAFLLKSLPVRVLGLGVFFIVAIRLFFFDTPVNLATFKPILNDRFPTFVIAIAAMYLAAYLYWRHRKGLREWEENLFLLFLGAANFFSLWILSAEIINFFDSRRATPRFDFQDIRNVKYLSLSLLWTVYAIGLLAVGIVRRSPMVRLAGVTLFAVVILKLFLFDVFGLEREYRVAAFVTLGVALLATGFVYQRYGQAVRGFIFGQAKGGA